MKAIIVAITGGSGAQYGLRLVQRLVEMGIRVHLIVSSSARKVMHFEVDYDYESIISSAYKVYDLDDIAADIASGTHLNDGMVVVPCSMNTLSAIASGFAQNLIHRVAGVMLKEERKLVLVPRETPLSQIHLENMLRAKQGGATILPASPGFYHQPKSIEDIYDFIVGKILNVMGISQKVLDPWDPDR